MKGIDFSPLDNHNSNPLLAIPNRYTLIPNGDRRENIEKFIRCIESNDYTNHQWYLLEEESDWYLLWALLPEYHNLSTCKLFELAGGEAVYNAIITYSEKMTPVHKNFFRSYFFPNRNFNRVDYTYQDFITEYNRREDLQNVPYESRRSDNIWISFKMALNKFVKQQDWDIYTTEEYYQIFYGENYRHPRNLSSLEDIDAEYKQNPEWHDLTSTEIAEFPGGNTFVNAVNEQIRQMKTAGATITEQQEFRAKYFKTIVSPAKDITLNELKTEYNNHPEWTGKTRQEIRETEEGRKFDYKLLVFVNGMKEEQKSEIKLLFYPSTSSSPANRTDISPATLIAESIRTKRFQVQTQDELKGVLGGHSFLEAIRTCVRQMRNSGQYTEATIVKFKRTLIPEMKVTRKFYTTKDFMEEWENNPEWHSLNSITMKTVYGTQGFLKALIKHMKDKLEQGEWNEEEALQFRSIFFNYSFNNPEKNTAEYYRNLWKNNPNWHGVGVSDVREHDGLQKFYEQLLKYIKEKIESGLWTEEEGEAFREEFFPRKNRKWQDMDIDDYREMWKNNPEFHGHSSATIRRTEGGYSFARELNRLLKGLEKTGKINIERKKEVWNEFFPRPRGWEFDFGHIHFGSRVERILGILIVRLGLVDKLIKGVNIHVKVSHHKRFSMDFLLDKFLIEYHPKSSIELKQEGLYQDDVFLRKIAFSETKYKEMEALFIWDEDHIYELLAYIYENTLNNNLKEKLKGITEAEINSLINTIRKETYEYDVGASSGKED